MQSEKLADTMLAEIEDRLHSDGFTFMPLHKHGAPTHYRNAILVEGNHNHVTEEKARLIDQVLAGDYPASLEWNERLGVFEITIIEA